MTAEDATARGTGTRLGKTFNVKVIMYEFSTPEDKQVLVDAFKKDQNQGLVNALTKMPAVGRIAITGTLGYDLSCIRLIPTETGRKIRFITNRQLRFGEVYANSQTISYNLTRGEFDVNDSNKSKNSGVLYPAAQQRTTKRARLSSSSTKTPGSSSALLTGTSRHSQVVGSPQNCQRPLNSQEVANENDNK